MCLAIPVKVKKIQGNFAEIENGKKVDISLVENLKKDDYILAHDKLAINKLTTDEAEKIIELAKKCQHQHT
jgi:hydrogenase assembly chaperone HypC/HupF